MTKEIKPNGEKLLPSCPTRLTREEDLKALIAYLRSLKAVRKETPRIENRGSLLSRRPFGL